jgi:hypothetical protein
MFSDFDRAGDPEWGEAADAAARLAGRMVGAYLSWCARRTVRTGVSAFEQTGDPEETVIAANPELIICGH